ncbi:hypothetical protein DFH09DRAFT_1365498 [Mycena vulgaris]|nr:hypothetical protein DFH09DRAFT_1365498 [Mycena vulgaris]
MPTPKCERLSLPAVLRDLLTTIVLCYLITLGLLHCIALHLDLFAPSAYASCGVQVNVAQVDYRAFQRALANVSHIDVLKVTTGCSVAAFAALELCLFVARRVGVRAGDPECGLGGAGTATVHPLSEKLVEKPYFGQTP